MSKTVSTSASCKHCGGTVIIEVTGLPDDMPSHTGRSGGVTSKMCPKCHKTSNYSYEIREHQFKSLR
jgi:hypothetical protein